MIFENNIINESIKPLYQDHANNDREKVRLSEFFKNWYTTKWMILEIRQNKSKYEHFS